MPGKAYILGEKRPEIFEPRVPGRIVPDIGRARGGNTVVTVAPTVNVSVEGGSRGETADREVAERIGSHLEGQLREIVGREMFEQMRPGGVLGR